MSTISAVGFEIMPDWSTFVLTFKNMDKANLGQLFIIMVFFGVYFINLFLVCRWSDLLSTAFTVQVATPILCAFTEGLAFLVVTNHYLLDSICC